MSTASNQLPIIDQAQRLMTLMFAQLDKTTGGMPIEVMLTELQIVVERLSFHRVTNPDQQLASLDDVAVLLRGDISPGVMSFIEWVVEQRAVSFFVSNNGRFFLSHCANHYRRVPEIYVSTPVELVAAFRAQLTEQLRQVHPLPQRIIFRVVPTLMAGCVIAVPDGTYDYSLQRTMVSNLGRYYAPFFASKEVPHG